MNNIEILEQFIKHYKEVQEKYKDDEIQAEIEKSCYFEEVPAEAIENLIQENKKLKKQMGKDLDVVYIKGVYDERDKWKNKIRELLEHYKNTGYDELEEVLQELLEKGE